MVILALHNTIILIITHLKSFNPKINKSTKKSTQLNADPVIPPEIPEWTDTMNMWGGKMNAALFILAEMAAVGFDMPATSFTDLMQVCTYVKLKCLLIFDF